jgi:hypothetical protein
MESPRTATSESKLLSRRIWRRETISANAPAGNAKRKMGKLAADCTRAIHSGDGVSELINQAAPTDCIQAPTFEINVASHKERKIASRSGAQGEPVPFARAVGLI